VQSWFTYLMAATKIRRESTYQKAERLVSEDRYELDLRSSAPDFVVGTCRGDHGSYRVFAVSQEFMDRHGIVGGRVGCDCRYGRSRRLCSHAIGAEELRKQGESQ
jgi:hypothetical protein